MKNFNIDFASTYKFWAGTSIAVSILLIVWAPHYSLGRSYIWTALSFFALQWVIYGIYAVVIYPRYVSPLRHLPTPPGGSFLFGHFWEIQSQATGIPMKKWINEVPNEGLIRYTHIFNVERLMPTSPKALGEVLTSKAYNFVKPRAVTNALERIIGRGLILAEGDEHKKQRKLLSPAFHFRHIKDLYPVFWSKSAELAHCLHRELAQKPAAEAINIEQWLSRATLDIIGLAGSGQDFRTIAKPDSEISSTYRKAFEFNRTGQILGVLGLFIKPKFLQSLPFRYNIYADKAQSLIRSVSFDLIQGKKQTIKKIPDHGRDIISIALKSGGFTDENLIDQMMTFIAAGHETTATAATWTIYELCRQSDCQRQLREEIHAAYPSMDDMVDASQLESLPYLLAVCNETLRHNPPVPITLRDTLEDCTIADTFVPRKTKIAVSPGAVNFSHELWGPDAADFKPSRWLEPGKINTGGAESNYAMLTFLHGPRGCIGQSFSRAELLCIIAALIGRFEFKLQDEQEVGLRGGLLSKPKGGMSVKMKVVEGW